MEAQKPMGVRHGDMVKVMSGRSKGKTGKVLSVNPAKHTVTVEHVEYHQEAYAAEPLEERPRRHSGKRRAHQCLERDAGLPWLRQAHAGGAHDVARRHQGAFLPPLQHDI